MKEKKAASSGPSAAAAQQSVGRTHGDGLADVESASVDGAGESGPHQDLSSFALPGLADAAAAAAPSESSSAVRPRAGSAGLKSLLKFRHSKKSATAAAAVPSSSPTSAAAASNEDGRPIAAARGGAHAAAAATAHGGTPPLPTDDHSPGSKGGFKGLLDSFRPRSKSDAASLRSAMLQRRRHQSGQAALTQTPAAAPVVPQGATPPTTAASQSVVATSATAAAENGQPTRPRATSFGARDAVLAKKAATAGATVNGSGSGGSGTAMSQLLSGGGSALSPRKLTPVEKNHHNAVSAYGGDNFSGKALLYRTLPAGDSGQEVASPGHRRAMSVSSANRRNAFKEQPWYSTDGGEVDMEIEDLVEDDPMVFVKFMKAHKCYNLIPTSAKLVIFDTLLSVKKAFFALVYNNVRAALLWDSSKQDYVGMLTISDFILILQKYYKSPNGKMEELEEHQISSWRLALKDHYKPKIVSISPDDSVNDAVRMLLDNKVHRLPVIDPITGNALYVMTHKRILKFIYLFMKNLPTPLYMQQTLAELKIGTYSGIAKVSPETTLIEALNTFVARRVSALPVVAKDGRVVDIYAKFDVINLAADKTYNNLDVPISLALSYRKTGVDAVVHRCHLNDKLALVVEKIVKAGVHRLIVCGDHDELVGILSLSDILSRMTLDLSSLSGARPSTVADVARVAALSVTGVRATVAANGVQ